MKLKIILSSLILLTSCSERVLTYSVIGPKGKLLKTSEIETSYLSSSIGTTINETSGNINFEEIDCSYKTKNHDITFTLNYDSEVLKHKKTVTFEAETKEVDLGKGFKLVLNRKN